MIFGGSPARPSRRRGKLIRREVMNADVAKPSYLKWSEVPITFDRKDHPDIVPHPGSYPLVVAPLFKTRRIQSYGPPWAHYLGGYQDRLLGGPLGLPDLRSTAPTGAKHKDCGGEVLG
jgi:hypothetical protein